ncbi:MULTISPECIES: GspE/PulE family protein [Pseudomonas]|uniref:Pilus assembly protein n=1 Tax=Pseudomonas fluorescens TaxID=294 RepID=A0A162B2P0_PSEFL|nr:MULTISPECIES: ATPase, T2SS/T4P/T4SS family [Pseudomonas]KZN20766.1 pilus assembly protein [Pseudomonas fluorescens]
MTENTKKTHRAILLELTLLGKITRQQADTQPVPDGMASIIPDILRVCKDDEAVALAVGKVTARPIFTSVDPGIDILQSDASDNWVIIAGILYLPNLFDNATEQNAIRIARREKWSIKSVGVISNTRLEQLRNFNDEDEDSKLDDETQKAKAAKRIADMLREAAKLNASDIHLQPTQGDSIAVRYRIDGELITRKMYKNSLHDAITRVIIESLSGVILDTSKPLDGKFEFEVTQNKKINLRMSSIPVVRGAGASVKIVLRLLGNNPQLANLELLGMTDENKAILRRLTSAPNGMIAYTGPTGSGKTTSQYAILLDKAATDPNKNYHTLEEPVEFQHENMSHTEVGGLVSTAEALAALLRQDPDVIYVGEMRDKDTALLAFQASQTGHLVLTTLHTNDTHEAIGRLSRMGVDIEMIVSNTRVVVAQRLVRTLCSNCKEQYEFRTDLTRFTKYGTHSSFKNNADKTLLYRASRDGCSECKLTESHHSGGLKGRRGVVEIWELTPDVKMALLFGETPSLLRRRQMAEGTFKDLWDDGLRLVVDGVIGFSELEAELKDYLEDRSAFRYSVPATNDNNRGSRNLHTLAELNHRKDLDDVVFSQQSRNNSQQPAMTLDNLSRL